MNTEHDDITALMEFNHCYCYKFGGINDEVVGGHPLFEHGLETYDEIFECIADDYKVKVFKGRIKAVYDEATKKLFD